jgi:hypothetical protein
MLDILTSAVHQPDLTGALCQGRSDLFELRNVHGRIMARRQAREACRDCPVLTDCRH